MSNSSPIIEVAMYSKGTRATMSKAVPPGREIVLKGRFRTRESLKDHQRVIRY